MGIGDWGLGIGDWGLGPIPNPQSPIPNPQCFFILILMLNDIKFIFFNLNYFLKNEKNNIRNNFRNSTRYK